MKNYFEIFLFELILIVKRLLGKFDLQKRTYEFYNNAGISYSPMVTWKVLISALVFIRLVFNFLF